MGENEVVNNNFTSLRLPEWTVDAQSSNKKMPWKLRNRLKCILIPAKLPVPLCKFFFILKAEIEGKKFIFAVKFSVCQPKPLQEAVKYYDPKKNTVSDAVKDNTRPSL